MYFDIITLFPDMFSALTQEGVIARAIKRKIIYLKTWQLRDFSDDNLGRIDDKPYGGGAGMVMQVKPIRDCIRKIRQQRRPSAKVVYLTPQGRLLNQNMIKKINNL